MYSTYTVVESRRKHGKTQVGDSYLIIPTAATYIL